jgi:hypothetical protein
MEALLLCAMLNSNMKSICWELPKGMTCETAIRDWTIHAVDWEKRSHISRPSAMIGCRKKSVS